MLGIAPREIWVREPQRLVDAGGPKFLVCPSLNVPTVSGNIDVVVRAGGRAIVANPTGAALKYPAVTGLTDKLTIVLSLAGAGWTVNGALISQRSAWSATGIPFELVSASGPALSVRIIGNTANNYSTTLRHDVNTFVVTWNGVREDVFHSGRHLGSTARAGTITNNTTNCTLNALPDGSGIGYTTTYLAAIYDRVLDNPAEISANPWQIFKKSPGRLYFFPSAGGGGATGSFAVQEPSPDTASFTGDVIVQGSFSPQEGGVDSASFAGLVKVQGSFAVQEPSVDTSLFEGQVVTPGSVTLSAATVLNVTRTTATPRVTVTFS